MKKGKIILVCLLLSVICKAQTDYGLSIGVVNSTLTPDYLNSSKFNYLLSGYSKVMLCENFYMQLELGVANKGSIKSGVAYNLKYIILPVTTGYNITNNISISGGIELSRLLSVRIGKAYVKGLPYLNHDISYVFNVSYSISKRIGIDIRMVNGLLPVFEGYYTDDNGDILGISKEYNRSPIQIILKVR